MASTPSLLRSLPLLRHRLHLITAPHRRLAAFLSTLEASPSSGSGITAETSPATAKPPYPPPERAESAAKSWADHPDYRRWKDIQPIKILIKDILHSDRYMDGECLCPDDEKEVVEKLLAYHPRSEDKIGCGLASIMVDRHPTFKRSRCLFVVRTDGVWIDFSYQKCLRAYIREKYPSCSEKFIRGCFKGT